jgi:hypothetical protein
MPVKRPSDDELRKILAAYNEFGESGGARHLGIPRETFKSRRMMANARQLTADVPVPVDPMRTVGPTSTVYDRDISQAKRFIITSALNATPVDPVWWSILRNMAGEKEAELLVIPMRYKNPTSEWTGSQSNEEFWVDEVRPFLFNQRRALNKNLTLLADIKIQPTASAPTSGADAIAGASSAILGHTKLEMRSIAAPSNAMAKILTTTGACTIPNYTDSRVGHIAAFHHSLSAIMVELDGSKFHIRQLHFNGDSCIDLDREYRPTGESIKAPRALALVMGDTHVRFVDPDVVQATFGLGGIIETIRPTHLIWHDVLDGHSCNPHHGANPFHKIAKRNADADDVEAEVVEAMCFVKNMTRDDTQSVIVSSNHDDFLRRWIATNDWRTDPTNAEFYLETALEMVKRTRMGPGGTEYPNPFALRINRQDGWDNVRALDTDDSFVLGGIELSGHGDRGPNGARGSIKNLRRIGIKSVIGHGHSPGINEGCYQAGTSTRLRLEYNHGASSWLNAHVAVNADGKRQIILIIDGEWHA